MDTIAVTGATSGIGLETVRILAKMGYQILAVGHSAEGCEKADRNVLAENPNAKIVWFTADLMQQREVARVVGELRHG